jgi:hypothetical protein
MSTLVNLLEAAKNFERRGWDSHYRGKRGENAIFKSRATIGAPIPVDLAKIIDAWPRLPNALKAAILAIITCGP